MARIIDGKDQNMVGDKIRKLRTERRMSQQMLSDRLETLAIYICRGSISRIEEKRRTVTDIELYGLAQILGVSIEELEELGASGILVSFIPVNSNSLPILVSRCLNSGLIVFV